MLSKDEYIQEMKLRLDEFKIAIDKLEGKPHLAEVKIMTMYQSKMSDLRLQFKKALINLDEVKAVGENNWEHLKIETEKALDAIANSLHDFKSKD